MSNKDWNPIVGVVIATKDRPLFLRDAISSVVSQTYNNWTVCVVNDGGLDISHVLSEFSDSRIRLIDHNRSYGVSEARNTALRILRSEIVVFLDDDDEFEENYFFYVVENLRSSDVFICGSCYVYERVESGTRSEVGRANPYAGMPFDYERLLGGNYIPFPSVSYKVESFSEFFDVSLPVYEDWDFLLRLTRNRTVVKSDDALVKIRQRVDEKKSLTHGVGFLTWINSFEKLCQKYPSENSEIILRRIQTRLEIVNTRYSDTATPLDLGRSFATDKLKSMGKISELQYDLEILSNGKHQGVGTAVLLHLYYPDLWPEFQTDRKSVV